MRSTGPSQQVILSRITIQLAYCDGFNDLDRILKAHLCNCLKAGGRYVEYGDYSIVSEDGGIIPPPHLRKLMAGTRFDMSIIKRKRLGYDLTDVAAECPHCHRDNPDTPINGWRRWY
ncbi:hypothetical protein B0H13DRAFT_2325794 [Mycena leptocephala]|nr:hypothetical protein B0H13DRAFT_2325794 [Mycena leptocephala]